MKITVEELLALAMKEDIHVIDIRSREEYLEGHIPNSIHIVSSELIYHPSKYLYRNVTYYLFYSNSYMRFLLSLLYQYYLWYIYNFPHRLR